MDVDSLLCLNDIEEKSFNLLKMKNKKNLHEILNDLKESVDCAVQDTGEDENFSKISHPADRINSSSENLEQVINIVSSTIEDLKEISENTKINRFHQNECAELIVLADKDQGPFENPPEKSKNFQENIETISRYPELFEIFSENSIYEFPNLSDNSKSENWSENNISRQIINENTKIFSRNSFSKSIDSEKCQVDDFDAEVKSIKESLLKPTKKKTEISSQFNEENIVPEKLSSINCELRKAEKIERPILLFNTKTIESKSSLSNITNKNTNEEVKIPIKRKKSNDSVHENHSSSKMKKVSSYDENVTPLISDTILSPRNKTSNFSLNSWRTLSRNHDENDFSGFNFFTRSTSASDGNRGNLKLNNRVKKTTQEISGNLESAQGDIQMKLNNNRIVPGNSDRQKNNKIEKNQEEYEASKRKIFLDVIDTLIGVKSILFENRKLVQSIQGHFQNCSIFHTIISDDAVTLLNEGISRCTMRIQSNEKSRDLFVGVNELLIESVRNLMKAVKEENEYLKQQEYYYCKHFLGIAKDNRNTGHFKRNTKHTLIGNDTLLSSSQKDRIEQLITYSASLIKRIVPKNLPITAENPQNLSKISPRGNPANDVETNSKNKSKESESTSKIVSHLEKPLMTKSRNKTSNNEKLTRSSTMVLSGSRDAKQFSNPMIKGTNKGRTCHNTQPIWKPAGNAKISLPVRPISRQNTRLIASDRKREDKSDASIRIPTSSRSYDPKKSFMQRSSTSVGSYELRKKSDMNFAKIEQKPMSARIENRKCNLITTSSENGENLQNENTGRAKWKTRQPEAIKTLKELIKNTSNDENEISPNCLQISNDNQISLHYLNSENKLDSSRSNFSSAMIIKSDSVNNSSKSNMNQEKSKIFEKSLNKKDEISRNQDSTKSKISSGNAISISAKLENENSVTKSSIKNSKSRISISRNNIEDKTSLNSLTYATKTKSEHRKPYLRKNSNDSSYLESYIKMNSRQSLVSNSAKSSTREKKSKLSNSNAEVLVKGKEEKNENKETEVAKIPKSEIVDFQANQNISQSVCELRTKVSSSKSCQVSFEASTCSANSDFVFDTETNSLASDNQFSETFIEKTEKFSSTSEKSFRTLKEILEKRGLNVNLVEDPKRKSSLREYGSFSSILLNKEKGTILAVCSSQTLFDKLASLSDSDFEIIEIKNTTNRISSESFDNDKFWKMERENKISSGSFNFHAENQADAENCVKSNFNVRNLEKDTNSTREIVNDRKENLEIFEITDKLERIKNEESSLIPEVGKSCAEIEKNIEKQTEILPGVEEKFSFVNLILKEEAERNRKPVNFGSIFLEKKTSQKDGENCFSVNLAKKGENSGKEAEIRCESQNEFIPVILTGTEEVIKEKEVLSVNLSSNKEINDQKSLLINSNSYEKIKISENTSLSDKPEFFSENLTSNEVKEFSSVKETEEEFKPVSLKKDFVEEKEVNKLDKINEVNSSGKILKIENTENLMLNEKVKKEEFSSVNLTSNEEIENKGKSSVNLIPSEKTEKELPNFRDTNEEKEDSRKESALLNPVAEEKNIKFPIDSKVNLLIKSKEFLEIEDMENSTPTEDAENKEEFSPNEKIEEIASVNLTSTEEAIIPQNEDMENLKHEKNSKIEENSKDEENSKTMRNSKDIKTSEDMKNCKKRLESMSKSKKKLSPVKSDDERFKKRLNAVLKAIATKSENLLQETESIKSDHQEIASEISLANSNSFSKLKILSVKIPKTKLNVNSAEEISSKLSVNLEKKSITSKDSKLSSCSESIENSKNSETFKYSENRFKIKENSSGNEKKMDNLFMSRKRRNTQKCKYCGKRRKCSSNLSCPLEMGISVTSEVLKIRNENLTPTETISTDDYSLPTVIKFKDSKIHEFTMFDTPNRFAQNLAVATLKLATKRAQNLYKDVVLCRQCLTSRSSHDSESTNSSRRENNFEFSTKQNCTTEKDCLGFKNAFFENKFDFSTINGMNSKTFRRALKIFRNSSNRRENLCVNHKDNGWNNRISKHFSKSFPIVLVVCFLILWYLF